MKRLLHTILVGSGILLGQLASAGVLFFDPPGGWTYQFNGDKREPGGGADFDALDGSWSHNNGSDQWDGSEIGGTFGPGNGPGGISVLTESGFTYLRMQDPGDPRDYSYADPSNRKVYLGHNMTDHGASETQISDGVTLSFRARIPTAGPLDPLHRDGLAATQPYPATGDGYVTSDGGKGNFVLKESTGGAIAFSFTQTTDTPGGDPNASKANFAGLTMNEFAGNAVSGNVNFGQGTGTNVIAFDPTQWHELWIVLKKDPANIGTHQAFIYLDGSLTPTVFRITAGNGSDYSGMTYLAMGMTATPQNAALDVDFVAYKLGAFFPPGFAEPAGGWTYQFNGDKREPGNGNDFDALDGTWSHNNGSDQWDGSEIGGTFGPSNGPGGVSVIAEGGGTYLRIQDPGDPRDYGYPDPSNRKVYLGHNLSDRGATETQLDDGVTLTFRARIPTTGPLDPLHRDGLNAAGIQPYPPQGDGYVTSDGGKGNFVIKQSSGGAIAFSLTQTTDTPGGDPNVSKANFAGLTMNEFAGNAVSGNVNFGQGTGTNVIAFDPTQWHTFWITLRKDPGNIGTHQGFIYLDGNLTPTVFKLTAGNGSDYSGMTYLAIGSTATPQNSALDIDFVAYKLGAVFPGDAIDNLPPEITDVTPPLNTSFHPAAQGLSFTATTQGNNELHAAGFKLLLNGQDVSSSLSLAGTTKARTVTYSQLTPNAVYQGTIIVADQAGRKSTNQIAFDTLVQANISQVALASFADDIAVNLPAQRARLFLRAGATEGQLVRVDRVANGVATVLGVFIVPRTGGAAITQLTPLTDAFGQPVVIGSGAGGEVTLRIKPYGPGTATPVEVIAAPATEAITPAYIGFLAPLPGAVNVSPDAEVRVDLVRTSGAVATGDLALFVDNASVTSRSVTGTAGNTSFIRFQPDPFFAGGSAHTVSFRYPASVDGVGIRDWNISVGTYPLLKASWATPLTSVTGKPRGFTGRIHKARNDASGDLFPNNPLRAASQLANAIIDPDTTAPFINEAAGPGNDGSFVETESINYDQNGTDEGIPGDRTFPNLDALDQNYIALQVVTYLNLTKGAHRLAVACDDGFVVWSGPSAAQATNEFGIRNPGGGTVEVAFDLLAEQTGIYAFRLIYFEGNGGADLEWYSINLDNGEKTLLNGAGGIAAYQSRTGDGTNQLPPPPSVALSTVREGNNVVVSWPKTTPAFRLQNSDLIGPAAWNDVTAPPVDNGTSLSVRVSAATGTKFYRLIYP